MPHSLINSNIPKNYTFGDILPSIHNPGELPLFLLSSLHLLPLIHPVEIPVDFLPLQTWAPVYKMPAFPPHSSQERIHIFLQAASIFLPAVHPLPPFCKGTG